MLFFALHIFPSQACLPPLLMIAQLLRREVAVIACLFTCQSLSSGQNCLFSLTRQVSNYCEENNDHKSARILHWERRQNFQLSNFHGVHVSAMHGIKNTPGR